MLFNYEANLWNRVVSNQNLTARDARSFVNNIYYGGFKGVFSSLEKQNGLQKGSIASAVQQHGLKALPTELKLNLYEAIANDGWRTKGNTVYLNELNTQMGLTQEFYASQTAEAHQFFSNGNKAWIESKWKQAGHTGTFATAMHTQIHSNGDLSDPAAQKVAKFAIEAFSEFNNRPCPEINFVHECEESCGATGTKPDGTEVINLNINARSFKGNFLNVIDTGLHEQKHIQQKELATRYLAGKILKNDPEYVVARVFAANLKTKAGYIPSNNEVGFHAYEDQPAEIDARTFGKTAAHLARRNYAHPIPQTPLNTAGQLTFDFARINRMLAELQIEPRSQEPFKLAA